MAKYNNIPLAITRAVKQSFEQIRNFAKKYSEHIIISKDSGFVIELRGIGDNSKYFFQLGKPHKDNNKYIFQAYYAPASHLKLDSYTTKGDLKTIMQTLQRWYGLIIEMDTITVHPEDEIEQHYKEEFDDWFEIIDDDADTRPFSAKQQFLITNIINKSITLLLEEGFADDDPIIEKANWLKNNLGRLTKKQVIAQIKEVFAPIRKMGWEITKKVYDVSKNETVAMGYRWVVTNLGESFFNLLEG